MQLRRPLAIVIAAAGLWSTAIALAAPVTPENNPQKVQAQIRKLEADISRFRKMLDQTKGQKAGLERQLETNEKHISNLMKQVDKIEKKLRSGKKKISDLKNRQQALESAKETQKKWIVRQVRAAYRMGNQQYLEVMLSQQDPSEMSRMLTYYDYFNRARVARIAQYRHTIASLEQVSRQIAMQDTQLNGDRIDLKRQEANLQSTQRKRHLTLVALNRRIHETGSEISTRVRNKEHLEALLNRITQSIAGLPAPADMVPFAREKGKLLLPVAGRITNRFGAARDDGKLHWDGIFISAPAGTPVRAIDYGRVVFSNWLRGFGLLLIIDHGDGYMSLYAHNEILYTEVGDWVSAGEIVATVGDTGGQNRAGLYFEIRHKGIPTNPQLWCRARPKGRA